MDWLNPVEWAAWIYGKVFQDHAVFGGILFVGVIAGVGLLVWIRGVDKYKEDHFLKSQTDKQPPKPQAVAIPEHSTTAQQVTTPQDNRIPQTERPNQNPDEKKAENAATQRQAVLVSRSLPLGNKVIRLPRAVKAVSAPVVQETAPQVPLTFDPKAWPGFPHSNVRQTIQTAEPSDEILEEIRGVLEKDRDSGEMDGCSAGKSIELRRVGESISYYACVKRCFASWKTANVKRLDFGGIKISSIDAQPTLAMVRIPCLPPTPTTTDYGLCVMDQMGTFPTPSGCYQKKVKTDWYYNLDFVVHVENSDEVEKLWKKFGAQSNLPSQ
jgi:hypothetical protein